ncbi:TetR/AcrR family transcriptional regulator [Paradevosia shaoguanensis]|uniref:TetR/AcrR family transcriptional regulator n=1 Tax=Paradevosia shaoguanensis TaxID=1335043 RepID=A0AA41QQB8_9HYPH|nr:TetR/AcrR family transcriptional regulator [Paradevosia shaoguanensis]MCF1743904.1 TetR/AcrR family transcriptional regulator [Paradevosia shaoguanensis]MCI0128387.1 TetR/AcrR family transcriptional regulator [Paradevosia shaoguanensis]
MRRALVEAGLRLLTEGGADSLGLREVARAVGVSASAPYRHFENRQALLAAVAREGFLRLAAALDAAGRDVPDAQRLETMGAAYLSFARENPQLFRLMFSPEVSKDANPELMLAASTAYGSLAALAGVESPEAKREATVATWALVHGLSVLLLDDQVRLNDEADRDRLVVRILSRFVAGLRTLPNG